jgi:hypothetical protein
MSMTNRQLRVACYSFFSNNAYLFYRRRSGQLSTHVPALTYTKHFIFNQSETSPYRTLIQDTMRKRTAGEINM